MQGAGGGPAFGFDNSFVRDLPGFFLPVKAARAPAPRLFRVNRGLAQDLGLDPDLVSGPDAAAWFSGNAVPFGAEPVAQVYAGHQFGGFSPQLGDGRAMLLGEVIDRQGARRDIALKGSGPTPFSRRGDGKAVLGPVLREYLIGEAMHALGIPTTRALAAVTTGEQVWRDTPMPGAVLTRVAASHIRVGTFQFFAARGEGDKLRALTAYTIARHYPDAALAPVPALALLQAVVAAQARLIAQWMAVGFIHGVMNTDNMALSGETIDYGPCAFLDAYAPGTVFSSIDTQGRYAYANQPGIAQWNLARLAETLLDQIDTDPRQAVDLATEVLRGFEEDYEAAWLGCMRAKLGLMRAEHGDAALAQDLLDAMSGAGADWTITFRSLSALARGDGAAFHAQTGPHAAGWRDRLQARWAQEPADPATRAAALDRANPSVIPRNHMVEEALAAAVTHGDPAPFDRLLAAITDPFATSAGRDAFALGPPAGLGPYRTFCGT